jgi:3'(2'), 5'-bisphosphate nucleotidase
MGDNTHHIDDARLARSCADAAARELIQLRAAAGENLRERGDALAHQVIMEQLLAAQPGDAVLSEEATDDAARLTADRVWIVDPLDGTREFAEPRRVDWAVHVALWVRGRLAAAAVALPALGVTLDTDHPPRLPTRHPGRTTITISRSRAPSFLAHVARSLEADLVPLGSAGYKVAAVIRGEVDAYVHAGGQYEWDSAAPVAVALASGLHASRLDGSALVYNAPDPYLPDLLVCRPELADDLLWASAAALSESGVTR